MMRAGDAVGVGGTAGVFVGVGVIFFMLSRRCII